MGDVVKLHSGRTIRGKSLPKPIECKECGEDVETARVQALTGDNIMRPNRCFACQTAWERRFARNMEGIRANQTVPIMPKPAAPREACANCRAVVTIPEDDKQGYCRRHPPHFMPPSSSAFPPVRLDMWCGDYERQKPAVKR